jgi:CRP/FNR family transcriptional regulator
LTDVYIEGLNGEFADRMMRSGTVRSYAAWVTVFSEGEAAEFLPTVLSGSVKMVRYPEPGKELIIGTFSSGEIFAIPPAIDGKDFPATAVTMEESRLLLIPRDRFCRLLEESPQFSTLIMRRMCGIMRDRSEKIRILSRSSAEQRIAKVLVSIADTSAGPFPLTVRLRRQDIAEMAGQTLESTIRTIRRLKDRGLLRIVNGKIVLPEIEPLRRLSE